MRQKPDGRKVVSKKMGSKEMEAMGVGQFNILYRVPTVYQVL